MTQPFEEILNEIKALTNQDYRVTEGKIRKIHNKISALTDGYEKQELKTKLNESAGFGLSGELNKLIRKHGLLLKALALILKHLTDVPELAQYLYETEKDKLSEEGLGIVSQRLGPQLEVLGGLKSNQVNVSKSWVIKLIEEAPSFKELSRISATTLKKCCEGLTQGEKNVVFNLVWIAESNQKSFLPDKDFVRNNAQKKEEEKKKLEEAKFLMKEAQELASADLSVEINKTALKEKIADLLKKLDFPSDWLKQEKMSSKHLLQTIEKEIEQIEDVIKSSVPYNSLEEIVTKASGGLALRGVYYSEYAPPKTASIPILLSPDEVDSFNPQGPFEEKFLQFSKKGTAEEFAQTVESSGFNAAIGIIGSSGLIDGEISAAGGYEKRITDYLNTRTSTSNVSVMKLTRIGQKAFQIRQTNMRLSIEARMMALSIVDEKDIHKQKDVARTFFERYGSHVCGGVHNLGGMFFSIAAAHSNQETSTSSLTEAVTKRLETKLSANFSGAGFGVGGSTKLEVRDEEIITAENEKEKIGLTLSYSIKSIGPNAKNPVTFGKLLSTNNATWAVLDRGETSSYIPVWDILNAKEYKKSASVMKQTWEEEEKKKKEFKKVSEEIRSRIGVGSRVWARWTNMLYYPGTVTAVSPRIFVQFDDGDKIDHDPSDLRAIIADNIPDPREVTVGTRVIADFKNRRRLYYPGTVRAVQRVDARYKVHFDDGDKDSVDLERVRLIPTRKGPSPKVGSRVWARWTNMLYYPGTVTAVSPRIFVQFDDGDKIDHDPNDFRAIIADNAPDYTEVFNGTRVIADFKRRGRLYYPGTVKEGIIIGPRYEIQFDDGDEDTVSLEKIRLIPQAKGPATRV